MHALSTGSDGSVQNFEGEEEAKVNDHASIINPDNGMASDTLEY